MEQPSTPTQLHTETPLLLTKAELMDWLKVSRMWVAMRLTQDPEFVRRCVIDIATPGSSRQTLRFVARAVADYLGIPDDASDTDRKPARAAA